MSEETTNNLEIRIANALRSSTPDSMNFEPYNPSGITIPADAVGRLDVIDSYSSLNLQAFLERVASHLGAKISVYSLADDRFVRIYTSDEETAARTEYDSMARHHAPTMDALVTRPPGMYVADFGHLDRYVGIRLNPHVERRRSADTLSDEASILINVQPRTQRTFADSDLQFLRLLMPLISKGLQWTQLIALKDRDEQGFIRDKDQFYEIVMERIRRTASTGTRYGVIVSDLRDFGTFNKISGQDIGDAVLESLREGIRTVIRAGDIAALKQYSFKVLAEGGVEVLQSNEIAQKGGDEHCFLATARTLGDLVIMGRRLIEVVERIDVEQLFTDEEQHNPDFDARAQYDRLCRESPSLVTNGRYRLRLNVGVTLLQPPTDEELEHRTALASYSRRAVYQTDRAMQDAKLRDKSGLGLAIGYRMLEPDMQNRRSVYRPGLIAIDEVDSIRKEYTVLAQDPTLHEHRGQLDRAVETLLYENLVPTRTEDLSVTQRFPIGAARSITLKP